MESSQNPYYLLICFFITFFAYTSMGLIGFGAAIIFQIQWYLASIFAPSLGFTGDVRDAVLFLAIVKIPIVLTQAILHRRYIEKSVLFTMALGEFPGMFLGSAVLVYVESPWIKRGFGFLLLGAFILLVWKEYRSRKEDTNQKKDDEEVVLYSLGSKTEFATLLAVSIFAGFFGGIFGTPGPPYMVYLMFNDQIGKLQWRPTFATINFCKSPVKAAFLISAAGEAFDWSTWPIYLCFFVGGYIGLLVGFSHYCGNCIDKNVFRNMILVLLFTGAVLLCSSGFQSVSYIVSIVGTPLFLTFSLVFVVYTMFFNTSVKDDQSVVLPRNDDEIDDHNPKISSPSTEPSE